MKKLNKINNNIRGASMSHSSKIGILEWFHKDDFIHVENTINDLKNLGINNLRTGLSWADFHSEGGEAWFDWLIPQLAKHFTLLPCVLYTPPSLGLEPNVMSPPKEPKMYADFIDQVINKYGNYFEYIELWNEPNDLSSYNNRLDPTWERFIDMISMAAHWAKKMGKRTVLGGMSPIDPYWLENMARHKLLKHIDVVGIHGFPKVFDSLWSGWDEEVKKVRKLLDKSGNQADIWITETGYSTLKYDEQNQVLKFIDAITAPVSKVFWYSLYDLSPNLPTVDGFHQDEREYHFGMKRANGISKILFRALTKHGIGGIEKDKLYTRPIQIKPQPDKGILITGGAGFIGTNLADRLLTSGERVIIYDNLSRAGVENNLKWLQSKHPQVEIMVADVKDFFMLKRAVEEASHVFHFAAQVAVTSSLIFPDFDHEVNVGGTINLLEAIRQSQHKPSLIFTSTNKVYGDLSGLELTSNITRYFPLDAGYYKYGINENYPLNFHSPYGSSKGAADQYVLDYARSYGLKNVVFRMSCIYGPHQFGTEDQGWVAHFIKQSIQNKTITLYGDGKQVRDILYIDDLLDAFLLAKQNINHVFGEAFNIGGGSENAVSLIELLEYMDRLDHLNIHTEFDTWRTGDQKYYVSDTRKFKKKTGWQPKTSYMDGITNLYNWLHQSNKQYTASVILH